MPSVQANTEAVKIASARAVEPKNCMLKEGSKDVGTNIHLVFESEISYK